MRQIKAIVVHCAASEDSIDIGAAEIKHLHTAPKTEQIDWYGYKTHGRGWSDIGYHYVIRRSGVVENGRDEDKIGAHVYGHNRNTIGVCVVGRKDFSPKQLESLKAMVKGLCHKHSLDPTEDVLGHYELDSKKSCPNIDMVKFRAELIFK